MKKYMNPPIPNGFVHVSGTWDKAFVIEDVKNKNCFTWIPLGFSDRFEEYAKSLEENAMKYDFIKDMIKKHQGIYVSTYLISKNSKGKVLSIKGEPISKITFRMAKDKAVNLCKELGGLPVRTRLIHEIEYDMIIECLAYLCGKSHELISNEEFEKYGLYGMNELWIWTLTSHSDFSMILKKGDCRNKKERVYANNEWFESPEVGFRVVLILF